MICCMLGCSKASTFKGLSSSRTPHFASEWFCALAAARDRQTVELLHVATWTCDVTLFYLPLPSRVGLADDAGTRSSRVLCVAAVQPSAVRRYPTPIRHSPRSLNVCPSHLTATSQRIHVLCRGLFGDFVPRGGSEDWSQWSQSAGRCFRCSSAMLMASSRSIAPRA